MPPDQLTLPAGQTAIEHAIRRLLAGDPLPTAAANAGLTPDDLAAAAEIYHAAGSEALTQHHDSGWQQLYLRFTDWQDADHVAAAHLLPVLDNAEQASQIDGWWFIRKNPCWRLRLRPTQPGSADEVRAALDQLTADGHLTWWPGTYEAETAAFGGGAAMDTAHTLFTADSRGILALTAAGGTAVGRRELSILLCSALARGAGLEWYERGDLFDRVCTERPLPPDVPADKLTALSNDFASLLRADTTPEGPLFTPDGPMGAQAAWGDAFQIAGRDLAQANRAGQLHRGLRDILSYHVIFHWNRLGLPARTQALLAHAARQAILGPRSPARRAAVQPASLPAPDPDRLLGRFPLVHQGRLFCPHLAARVTQVEELAHSSTQHDDPDDRVNAACAAWNLAALIAADCDLPELAADLCHRQFDILHAAWPLTSRPAIASLQPLINLARLDERAGNPSRAFHTLGQIDRAARTGGIAHIGGRTIDFARFLADDGQALDPFLRRVLREDGTRALAATGDWERTAEHAARYDDAPERMGEVRQAQIIAAVLGGRFIEAADRLDTAETPDLWERAVAACLRTYLSAKTGDADPGITAAMITAVQRARGSIKRGTTVFRIRLGLTALDLAATHPREGALVAAELAADAQRSASAYAARDVLEHPICRALLPATTTAELGALVEQAGLHAGTIPAALLDRLHQATETAAEVLAHTLRSRRSTPHPRHRLTQTRP
jgi:thiopeptide-type bacteriocin biosynthesis protein